MESIKFTLYEISGYLLPGTISFAALLIGYSLINNNVMFFQLSIFEIVMMAIFAYFMGHLNQAVGNFICVFFEKKAISKRSRSIERIRENLNLDQSLTEKEAFGIIMNISMAKYKIESMDIFTEREGFYRGSTVGCLLLSISFLISLYFNEIKFINGENYLCLGQSNKLFFLVIAIISGGLFFLRYLRFLKYRINVMIDAHN